MGISLAGFAALTKFPFKIFVSKVSKEIASGKKITINPNPSAVKRESGVKNNG